MLLAAALVATAAPEASAPALAPREPVDALSLACVLLVAAFMARRRSRWLSD